MYDPKLKKQPALAPTAASASSTGITAMAVDPALLQDRIRARAYELYEGRGREPGQEEQDWFRAERELLKRER